MSGILVVAETRQGSVLDTTLELVTTGLALKDAAGGPLQVVVLAQDPAAHAAAVTAEGVDEVLTVALPSEHFEAGIAQRALAAVIESEQPTVVVLAHSVDSFGYGPAVAAALGLGFASDVTDVRWEDGLVAERAEFANKLVATLDFPGKRTTLLQMRTGVRDPATPGGSAPVRAVDVSLPPAAVEHVELVEVPAADVDIATAELLLSIGRGVEEREQIAQFEELAQRMGAVLAASRPLVDAGWMPSSLQVGQSGKIVKPKVYLALGISGAVQHLAGIRAAETVIAVNTDAEAPIFTAADYGAVADLFEVADELERLFG